MLPRFRTLHDQPFPPKGYVPRLLSRQRLWNRILVLERRHGRQEQGRHHFSLQLLVGLTCTLSFVNLVYVAVSQRHKARDDRFTDALESQLGVLSQLLSGSFCRE